MSDLHLSPAAASAWLGTPLLRRGLLALAGGLLSLLGGCAVYSSGQPVYDDYRQPLVYSQTEPVREVVTVRPNVGVVWVPGVWVWGGTRHHWRPGHWAGRPSYYGNRARWAGHPRGQRWHAPRAPRSSMQMPMRSGGWRR